MPPKKVKSLFFFLVRVIISGGILFYLFRKTDLENLKAIFLRINLLYYILAFLCVVIFQSLVALRWKFICGSWNFHKSFIYFLQIYLMGFSLNTVFPGIIAGDTLRGYFLVKEGLEWKKATFSVILDRAYGLLGIMVILSLSLPFCSSFLPPKFRIFLFLMVYTSLFSFFLITLLVKKKRKFNVPAPFFSLCSQTLIHRPYHSNFFCISIYSFRLFSWSHFRKTSLFCNYSHYKFFISFTLKHLWVRDQRGHLKLFSLFT